MEGSSNTNQTDVTPAAKIPHNHVGQVISCRSVLLSPTYLHHPKHRDITGLTAVRLHVPYPWSVQDLHQYACTLPSLIPLRDRNTACIFPVPGPSAHRRDVPPGHGIYSEADFATCESLCNNGISVHSQMHTSASSRASV